jgi:hypothetical protein
VAARLIRLRTKTDRLREDQAEHLRQTVRGLPGAPPGAISSIVAAIDRETAATNGWTFVMLSPAQNRAVMGWLRSHSCQPMVAMLLWAEMFMHLEMDTGHISATRQELADAIGANPRDVSRIVTELVSIGAVTRWREKTPGIRGDGALRLAMNPHVATHLPGAARDAAQKAHKPLTLVPSA